MSFPIPFLPNHNLYMSGDKVKDKRSVDIFRVKARFAHWDVDYITLENVETKYQFTLVYFDIIDKLELVCHPITDAKFIN
jgi:hypothetical protein